MTLLKLTSDGLLAALEEPLREVTVAEWRENPLDHAEASALVIQNDLDVADLVDDLAGFDVIILDFPAFTDGRAYSQARLLRDRFGYRGEIRARGGVLRDQLFFMMRCGFDAFDLKHAISFDAQRVLGEFSHVYQAGADKRAPIWQRRLKRAAAA